MTGFLLLVVHNVINIFQSVRQEDGLCTVHAHCRSILAWGGAAGAPLSTPLLYVLRKNFDIFLEHFQGKRKGLKNVPFIPFDKIYWLLTNEIWNLLRADVWLFRMRRVSTDVDQHSQWCSYKSRSSRQHDRRYVSSSTCWLTELWSKYIVSIDRQFYRNDIRALS